MNATSKCWIKPGMALRVVNAVPQADAMDAAANKRRGRYFLHGRCRSWNAILLTARCAEEL